KVFSDSRGFFYENYNLHTFAGLGLTPHFIQDNVSRSVKGVLRGLHYQLNPYAQGKLVRVSVGEVFDVAVDIREGSPTFGKWCGEILSSDNKRLIWIPPGFAHGFCVLSDEAEFTYKMSNVYSPKYERSISWNDPEIGIEWPDLGMEYILSEKDKKAPRFSDAEMNFRFSS
ncbi:MAG: dTDP-4-dehydrorhamnose 3,5-epimerase, partial [Chlorobiales bacterium]|nr:dTDP-4-dehydrorhamnose 3,5-epimerase [Chlorobiales bacterium]